MLIPGPHSPEALYGAGGVALQVAGAELCRVQRRRALQVEEPCFFPALLDTLASKGLFSDGEGFSLKASIPEGVGQSLKAYFLHCSPLLAYRFAVQRRSSGEGGAAGRIRAIGKQRHKWLATEGGAKLVGQ